MSNSIKMQFSLMINKLGFKVSFSCVLVYALLTYVYYLLSYRGADVLYFLSANQQYAGNELAPYWGIFQSLFPFLVVFPFAFSYLDDKALSIDHYIIGRMSRNHYYVGKLITGFLGGFIIIFIPFLLNLILCNLTFQENNNTYFGEYNLIPYFEILSGRSVLFNTEFTGVPFLDLYLHSPFLYNVFYLFLLSLFSGILSIFSGACAFFMKKHKILLLLPIYLLFYLSGILDSYIYINNDWINYVNYKWMDYVNISFNFGRNYYYFIGFIVCLLVFSSISAYRMIKKDVI